MAQLPDVIPLLVYSDIQRAHDFLVEAFAFSPGKIERAPDGRVVHGELYAGGQLIWLHQVWEEEGWVSAASSPVTTGELVVTVEDVDEHCERARAAGAEIEYEPRDMDYGVREYDARDLEGRRWAFVTPLG